MSLSYIFIKKISVCYEAKYTVKAINVIYRDTCKNVFAERSKILLKLILLR